MIRLSISGPMLLGNGNVFPSGLGLLTNLWGYWPMDDDTGTTAVDVHSTHDLSINATWVKTASPAVIGTSLLSSDLGQIASVVGPTAGPFTLAGWFDPGGGNNYGTICRVDTGGGSIYWVAMNGGTSLILYGHSNSAGAGSGPTEFGHYAMTWDGGSPGTLRLYVNAGTPTSVTPSVSLSGAMNISVRSVEGGWHDEWGFWTEEFSAAKIGYLYNGGAGLAYSDFT